MDSFSANLTGFPNAKLKKLKILGILWVLRGSILFIMQYAIIDFSVIKATICKP